MEFFIQFTFDSFYINYLPQLVQNLCQSCPSKVIIFIDYSFISLSINVVLNTFKGLELA